MGNFSYVDSNKPPLDSGPVEGSGRRFNRSFDCLTNG